jgi:hypothetical protein
VNIKIDFPREAVIGQPVIVKIGIDMEAPVAVRYAGLRLNAIRPCEKPLIIDHRELFCNGKFDASHYARSVSLVLPPKIIPSSTQRGIKYKIEAYSRVAGDTLKDVGDQEYFDAGEITIIEDRNKNKILEVNPVVLAIKGLKLNLQKDIYHPGETIKITFEARDLKELKILLMQRSNILCNCTQYGKVCTRVPRIPSSAAGVARTNNPTTGFLLLQLPRAAELSSRHQWEPTDKTTWNDKFGDFNEWYLAVTGVKYTNEEINFDIPIEIDEGRIASEKQDTVPFFESPSSLNDAGKAFFPAFQVKKLKIVGIERRDEDISIRLKNEGTTTFHGCTCRVTGIKDMFFETTPFMSGFACIDPGSVINLEGIKVTPGITEVAIEIDSNEGKLGVYKSHI